MTVKRVSEKTLALIIVPILAVRHEKCARIAELVETIPTRIKLTRADREESPTRPREALWHQRVTNIRSHNSDAKNAPGGYVLVTKTKATARAPCRSPRPAPEFETSVAIVLDDGLGGSSDHLGKPASGLSLQARTRSLAASRFSRSYLCFCGLPGAFVELSGTVEHVQKTCTGVVAGPSAGPSATSAGAATG